MKKLLKMALAGAMALSLVGCGSKTEGGSTASKGLTKYNTYQTLANEMETWNVLYSQSSKELNVLTNLQDALLTNDTKGQLKANLATEWDKNDDATVWTFKLREGVKWVDYQGNEKADLTAQDFITGLEYVLNYAKNGGANTSMAREMIKGAEEYYQMTYKEYSETQAVSAETEAKFLDMVGIEATDDYTIVYTMLAPKPYFDTLAAYSTLYPLSQAAVDEYGDKLGTDNQTIYYDGPYLCKEYVQGSNKLLVQNPTWWNTTDTRFEEVSIQMVESVQQAWNLFQSGEVDYAQLSEDALNEIYTQGESSEWYKYLVEARKTKYAYVFHFNYNAKLSDGTDDVQWNTAVANKNFRQMFYYGVDWTNYLKRTNTINPGNLVNDVYTCDGLVFTSDGTDYTDIVREKLGYATENTPTATHARLDDAKFEEVRDAAIEELEKAGVSFPVTLRWFYKSGDQVAADTYAVFEQMIEEQLVDKDGNSLIDVVGVTYMESSKQEIMVPELWSAYVGGWGADYGDPINYLAQEIDDTNAFYNHGRSDLTADIDPEFQEYMDLVAKADAITDLDERYEAFADAEVCLIEHAWVLPLYRAVTWEITRVNDYSKINGVYGIQSERYLNWETTSETAYTTEQYEAFKAAA